MADTSSGAVSATQAKDNTTDKVVPPASTPNDSVTAKTPKLPANSEPDAVPPRKTEAKPQSAKAPGNAGNPKPTAKPGSGASKAKPAPPKTLADRSRVATSSPNVPKAESNNPPRNKPSPGIFFAVLGQTGTGKTTFINDATESDLVVGHTMDSCTANIAEATGYIGNQKVTLIDTPGFDDSGRDDGDILRSIGLYLKASYDTDHLLRGVIYLHRITDNRMAGSSLRSLNILKTLCGPKYYNNIALATTMWSTISDVADGETRENQLKDRMDYWKDMIAAGAKVFRHDKESESAKNIISELLAKTDRTTQFQEELSHDNDKVIADTSAGKLVKEDLERMQREYHKKIEDLEGQISELESERKARDLEERRLRDYVDKLTREISKLEQRLDEAELKKAEKFFTEEKKPGWIAQCLQQ